MITLRPGSHAYRLLLLLSAAGEFPTRSMRLLGSVRSLEALVYRLEHTQQFRNESGADLGSCKMLSVSGKRDRRTIRLHKTALPLLNTLHPAALEQYLALSGGHRFSSSTGYVQRNHRQCVWVLGSSSGPMPCQSCKSSASPKSSPPLLHFTSPNHSSIWTAQR